MTSLREKFNSKINQTKGKPQSRTVKNFDQTWLKTTVVGGQSQLCPVKLNCVWADPNFNSKLPQLICKWFNKTETSISQIEGVNGSYYQPSLSDVGTLIHIQCMPELEGSEYQGMPIIKQIGPIKIDPETEEEANDFLAARKATFFIKFCDREGEVAYREGLIKVNGSSLKVVSRQMEIQKQIVNIQQIDENYPILTLHRFSPKKLTLTFLTQHESLESSLTIQLTNNKIRDVFALLVKLISVQKSNNFQEKQVKTEKFNSLETEVKQICGSGSESGKSFQIENKSQQAQNPKGSEKDEKSSSHHEQDKSEKMKSEDFLSSPGATNDSSKVGNIKSSEQLTISPKGKEDSKISPSKIEKQSAADIMQISDLKKQLRSYEGQVYQHKKAVSEKQQRISELLSEISVMKEREASLSNNFFTLEEQYNKIKEELNKEQEQMSYYKNESRILKTESEQLKDKSKHLAELVTELEEKLKSFEALTSRDVIPQKEQQLTFQILYEKYKMQQQYCEQLKTKLVFAKEQAIKKEEVNAQLVAQCEKAEGQRNYYKKKYESLTVELNQSQSRIQSQGSNGILSNSRIKKEKSLILSVKSCDSEQQIQFFDQNPQYLNKLEQEILGLKKNLKEVIEENNFLRSVNAAGKQKSKSSSKTHLKMQLLEMKKIVNRLTEAVTEKDLALVHMKNVNKDLNARLVELNKAVSCLQEQKSN